jgi:DNA-binding FadR family transcriptional regulator
MTGFTIVLGGICKLLLTMLGVRTEQKEGRNADTKKLVLPSERSYVYLRIMTRFTIAPPITPWRHARSGLHNQVAEHLGLQIMRGELAPGFVLPNETILGTRFGVSRTVLREAIKVLASKGLVEVRRKTGTRVRPNIDWNSLDPEVLSWQFSGEAIPAGITDLLELRRLIEPSAARFASLRATDGEITVIGEALRAMEKSVGDPERSVEADLRFHLAILEATHNSFMRPFGALVQAALRASFRLTNEDAVAYRRTLGLHRAVKEAIENKLPDEAEQAMHKLLSRNSSDIRKAVKKKPQNGRSKEHNPPPQETA